MLKKIAPILILGFLIITFLEVAAFLQSAKTTPSPLPPSPKATSTTPLPANVILEPNLVSSQQKTVTVLSVPYISEAPDNIWTGPWKNACEEAAIAMVEKFYLGDKSVSVSEAKTFMLNLFDEQDKAHGSNANSDATRTNQLINDHTSFTGQIKTNPSLAEIKAEITAGRPVIAFHRGFDLHNDHIPFLPSGSSYHSTVVMGFDEQNQEFLVNDPGDEIEGEAHRYTYEIFMNSLHDYNYENNKADGPAKVIFTTKK